MTLHSVKFFWFRKLLQIISLSSFHALNYSTLSWLKSLTVVCVWCMLLGGFVNLLVKVCLSTLSYEGGGGSGGLLVWSIKDICSSGTGSKKKRSSQLYLYNTISHNNFLKGFYDLYSLWNSLFLVSRPFFIKLNALISSDMLVSNTFIRVSGQKK